ncbi:hypothetical protein JCM8547_008798, partial [Rhodosporidiobolus lusitaniae]
MSWPPSTRSSTSIVPSRHRRHVRIGASGPPFRMAYGTAQSRLVDLASGQVLPTLFEDGDEYNPPSLKRLETLAIPFVPFRPLDLVALWLDPQHLQQDLAALFHLLAFLAPTLSHLALRMKMP